ncbi:MAG: hypothetical protein OXT06_03530 [Rhodospirillaceae bacterium]|nr:hypothetical protein [Rhodospirillaceae bacterium]MDD9928251.1 hypothetical protein [Rhodospirillaceae bacterium]
MRQSLHKRTVSLIAACAFTVVPAAAQDNKSVALPVNWAVGEKHRIEMIKDKERFRGDQKTTSRMAVPIDIEVLRRRNDGYAVRWTYGKAVLTGTGTNPIAERIVNLSQGMRIDLRTDALGSVVGLENTTELQAHFKRAGDTMMDWMRGQNLPPEALSKFEGALAQMSTPQAIEASALRSPGLFYMAFGGTYRLGEDIVIDDLIANPFGQAPFPTKARLTLRDLDSKAGTASIGWTQNFDREKAGPALEQTLRAIGLPVPADGNLFTGLAIKDDGLWIFDTRTGWMQTGSWQRSTVISGNLVGVERIKFRTLE